RTVAGSAPPGCVGLGNFFQAATISLVGKLGEGRFRTFHVLQKAAVNSFFRGEMRQRDILQHQILAVSKSPGGIKGFRIPIQAKRVAAFARRGSKTTLSVNLLDAR